MQSVQVTIVEQGDEWLETLQAILAKNSDMTVLSAERGDLGSLMGAAPEAAGPMVLTLPGEKDAPAMDDMLHKHTSVINLSIIQYGELLKQATQKDAKYYLVQPITRDALDRAKRADGGQADPSLDDIITALCLKIGIPPHIQGYQYIHEAIKMVITDKEIINSITKLLYPGIAERFGTTPSKVERSIRHAIKVVWARGRTDAINLALGYDACSPEKKPTNGEFIAMLANHCGRRQ